jgi:hypothetical protein
MRRLTWAEVRRRRLARHALLGPAPAESLEELVGALCGVHAQVMASAEIAVGLRVAGLTRTRVREALWTDRTLVRTVGIRGTIHLFPRAELGLWLAAVSSAAARSERRLAAGGIDEADRHAIIEAMYESLDGRALTHGELGAEVVARLGPWAADESYEAFGSPWPRWRLVVGDAAVSGALCFGPDAGGRVTFVRTDQWAGPIEPVDPAEAVREVLLRFLATYGPSTAAEFARWFGIVPPRARALLDDVRERVEEVDVEGHRAWLPAGDAEAEIGEAAESLHLLSTFDPFVVGSFPREQLLPSDWRARGGTPGTAATLSVLLLDGRVVGLWRRERRREAVEIRIGAFGRLSAPRRRLVERRVREIGAILERDVACELGPVEARPHR